MQNVSAFTLHRSKELKNAALLRVSFILTLATTALSPPRMATHRESLQDDNAGSTDWRTKVPVWTGP